MEVNKPKRVVLKLSGESLKGDQEFGLDSEVLKTIATEINKVSKLVPKEALNNIEKNISPQIDQIIEKSGFVKKSKYQNLKDLVDDLEKRISQLEKD